LEFGAWSLELGVWSSEFGAGRLGPEAFGCVFPAQPHPTELSTLVGMGTEERMKNEEWGEGRSRLRCASPRQARALPIIPLQDTIGPRLCRRPAAATCARSSTSEQFECCRCTNIPQQTHLITHSRSNLTDRILQTPFFELQTPNSHLPTSSSHLQSPPPHHPAIPFHYETHTPPLDHFAAGRRLRKTIQDRSTLGSS
jgi:hypothetical protein